MAMQADSRGFLIGNPLNNTSGNDNREAVRIWESIKSDTAAIRRVFEGGGFARVVPPRNTVDRAANDAARDIGRSIAQELAAQSRRQNVASTPAVTPVTTSESASIVVQNPSVPPVRSRTASRPPARVSDSGARRSSVLPQTTSDASASPQPNTVAPDAPIVVQLPTVASPVVSRTRVARDGSRTMRDERGRYRRVDEQGNVIPPSEPVQEESSDDENKDKKKNKDGDEISQAIKNGFSAATQNSEDIDPLIKSASEIKGMVDSGIGLVKAFGGVGKGIYKYSGAKWAVEKAFGRKSDKRSEQTAKWQTKITKLLERFLNRRPATGGGEGSGGLLSSLFEMMRLPMLAGGVAALSGVIGNLASLFGGFLKRVPVLGALFTAFEGFRTSTEEYAARLGVELNGSLAQELAVRFVGVLGDLGNNLTFGMAGKFGEWLSSVDFAGIWSDVSTKITDKFTGATDYIKTKFDELIESIKSYALNKVAQVKNYAGEKVQQGKAAVVGAYDKTANSASSAADKALSLIGRGSAGNRKTLEKQMDASGMTNPKERAMFLAQMDHESGGFRQMEESFKYRTPEQIMDVSATARKKGKAAVEQAMKGGDASIAELMYGGRMGNTEAGDAHKYRGRGFIQLTGKSQYAEASKDLGIDLVNNPDLAADPANAAKIATWYWNKRGLSSAAQSGDVTAVTRGINGGLNGITERGAKYQAYQATTTKSVSSDISPPPMLAKTAAVDSARLSIPKQPVLAAGNGVGGTLGGATNVIINNPVGQNVDDRRIAQVATGGIGA